MFDKAGLQGGKDSGCNRGFQNSTRDPYENDALL